MSSEAALRHLQVEAAGALRVVTLDRPPLNVLTIAMMEELDGALAALEGDPGVAAVLLTGAGKAFCAGVDVADHTADRVDRMLEAFHAVLMRLVGLEAPVVAALNGAALGGGLELALACDVVLAREGAKLGQPEIQLGVFPPFAAAVLPRLVGRATALDICLSGRTFTAEEARGMGLVQAVHPRDELAGAARAYAEGLATLSPPVLRLTKRAVLDGLDGTLADALAGAEALYRDDLMALADAHEGLAAFMEKRAPQWKGA